MRTYIFLVFMLFLSGCAFVKTPKDTKSLNVAILSPMIKISDIGFLHSYKNELNLQIYNSAISVANIKISKNICINRVCFSKLEFNHKFFNSEHYDEILSDIILKKPIYDGLNLTKNECGFIQNLKNDTIKYEICDNKVKFFDLQNRVKIIIKELK